MSTSRYPLYRKDNKSSQVKMCIGSNKQISITKRSSGTFKHKTCTKRRKVCIENMRMLLIGLTSITSFTYNNITLYLYNDL